MRIIKKDMKIINKDLKRRIIEISYKHNLSHLGSCLTAVDIIDEIYKNYDLLRRSRTGNEKDFRFVLSSGHAGLALYVVLEKIYGIDAEYLFNKHGVHPNRDIDNQIWCSSGSLGHGLPIAVGMALADRNKKCYTLVSDGEMNEGSCYEALQVAHEQKLSNLQVFINCNGYGAYKEISRNQLIERCRGFKNVNIIFRQTNVDRFPMLIGQKGHYISLTKEDYKKCQEILTEDLKQESQFPINRDVAVLGVQK